MTSRVFAAEYFYFSFTYYFGKVFARLLPTRDFFKAGTDTIR
jgi:hypothetical protein